MELNKLALVRGVQEILSDESKWCKKYEACDARGFVVSPLGHAATSFCIYGAARRWANLGRGQLDRMKPEIWNPFWAVMADIGQYDTNRVSTGNIGFYNDTHTFAEIQQRLKEVEAKYVEEEENAVAA